MQDKKGERQFYERMFSGVVDPGCDGYCITVGYDEIYERTVQRVPTGTIIDIACGGGKHAINLAKRGFRVFAIELTTEGIRVAREAARQAGVKIHFIQGDVEMMPFKEGAFDYSFCGLIFHHFPKMNKFMGEVGRITRKGIFGVEPNACEPVCFMSFNVINRLFRIKTMTKNQRAIFPGNFSKKLRSAGFRTCDLSYLAIRQHTTNGKIGKFLSLYQRITRLLPERFKCNKFVFSAFR